MGSLDSKGKYDSQSQSEGLKSLLQLSVPSPKTERQRAKL